MKYLYKSNIMRTLMMPVFLVFATTLLTYGQTLNPTDDTDSQSDVAAGTNTTLNSSQWCHLFMKFNLSSISGTVTSARLRIYQSSASSAYTLNVNSTNVDTWTEGGTKPTTGSLITSKSATGAVGYQEIDITSTVVAEMGSNKILSLSLTTNLGTWTGFNSRQNASNKPQLVVITSGDTQAPSIPGGLNATTITQTSFTLNWNQSTDNVGVTGYEVFRNGTSIGTTANNAFNVTGLTASTTYSMSVRARDAVPNWSAQSAALSVTTSGNSSATRYEAENAARTGTTVGTSGTGYSGTGYVTGLDATGDKITFTVNVASAGSYPLVIRYQNSCGACEKYQGVKINTASPVYTQFLATSAGWQDKNYGNVSLNAGNNTIEIIKDWGWTDIDYITVGSGGGGNNLTVSPSSLSFAASGGNLNISVTSNVSWTASDNQTWLSVSPGSGSNNAPVTVTAQTNTGTTQRTGSVTISGGGITRTISVTQSGTTATGPVTIGTNFWRVDWGSGWQDYFVSGVNWSTTTNPWRSDFVSDLTPYSVLRFMDWGPTNGSEFVNWSSRIPKTADHYNVTVPLTNGDGSTTTGRGVAYEWQIDLCNKASADMWINIPHKASDDFVRQLARLIRDNLTDRKKVYVEYSNEVWNWGFQQTHYADAQGQARGFVGSYPFKGNTVYINAWWGYYVYRSCQVARIFEEEFAGQTDRLVKVLGTQLGYDNWPDFVATWGDIHPVALQHMAALFQPSINPNNVRFDAYAVAPYWNGNDLASMQASITPLIEKIDEVQRALNNHAPNQMKLICYEAGQDGGNQVANAQNSGIYNVYTDALNRIGAKLQGPLVHYTHVGWDSNHAWGAKQTTSSTLAQSHKYRAIVDWVNANGAGRVRTAREPQEVQEVYEETSASTDVEVYPNPFNSDMLTIDLSGINDQGEKLVGLRDATGKLIQSYIVKEPKLNISRSAIPAAGLYHLRIRSANKARNIKVVVE
jgi:chitodextrinase